MTVLRSPTSRLAVVLTALVLLGQAVSLVAGSTRLLVLVVTLPLLDAAGAWACARAARNSPYPRAWRYYAASRAASVAAYVSFAAFAYTRIPAAYWLGVGLRTAMFVLIAMAAVIYRLTALSGRARGAFVAEMITVAAAAFMLAWYFVISPAMGGTMNGPGLVALGTFIVGDVLLVVALCVLVLGGAMPRLTHSTTPLMLGLLILLVADIAWDTVEVRGGSPVAHWYPGLGLVLAALLTTVAPLIALSAPAGVRDPLVERPAWAERIGLLSLLVAGGLMVFVTVREGDLLPWGGLVLGLIVMASAVMFRLLIALGQSRDQAFADPLTGLANRTGLDNAATAAVRRGHQTSLLLIDLDGFKLVNDAYGHAAGDTMLIEWARHMRSAVRSGDVCARIGGDEFAVLLLDTASPEQAAQRILAAAANGPLTIGDDTIPLRASIGLTEGRPEDTTKELLRRADLAMYQAKRAGTHSWVRHDASMVDRRAEDAALADDLEGATGRGELAVLYQPIVDVTTGEPKAYEALVRWHHPTRGTVSPLQFIPIAERTGLINDIGLFVLGEALAQLATWPEDHYVSVNLSPRQLQEPTLVHDVLAALRRTGISSDRLVLEVTESAIIDEQHGIPALRELRSHGIRIAVDDFGTGYSSLHYLTRLPVDILKIDRSFVAELNGSPEGSAITEAVIRLASALHLRTVAEGIETREQAAELLALGCTTGQGYLYAPPRPASALTAPKAIRSA